MITKKYMKFIKVDSIPNVRGGLNNKNMIIDNGPIAAIIHGILRPRFV
jgi:hypothetical protein